MNVKTHLCRRLAADAADVVTAAASEGAAYTSHGHCGEVILTPMLLWYWWSFYFLLQCWNCWQCNRKKIYSYINCHLVGHLRLLAWLRRWFPLSLFTKQSLQNSEFCSTKNIHWLQTFCNSSVLLNKLPWTVFSIHSYTWSFATFQYIYSNYRHIVLCFVNNSALIVS